LDFGCTLNLFLLQTEPFDDLLSYKGDLIIGLKFVPPDVTSAIQKKGKRSSRGSLNVLVKEAKNLTAVKANGTSDPFCKRYMLMCQNFVFLLNCQK
jgi:synaptotagmin-like protein